ncbi:MAG: response regulator [Candidatus Aminicenantes bacterium]|nr:response regulator [Candidatus Aminicenantes bacterium]
MEKKPGSFIRVYCPELMDTITPGEWTDCPFYRGKKIDLSNTEEALKQIFRCHVQCGCQILYQYYEGRKLVQKAADSIEDQESLRKILSVVMRQAQTADRTKGKRILIVDDDVDFLEMHSTVLKNRGYEVTTAQSAKECLEKLDTDGPDLVVLDVMMEKFDAGFEVTKKIKKRSPRLPVILLTSIGPQTGLDFSSNADVLEITGADILLDKPVSPDDFVAAIKRLTEAKD